MKHPLTFAAQNTGRKGTVVRDHYLKFSKDLAQQPKTIKIWSVCSKSCRCTPVKAAETKLVSLWWPLNLDYAPLICWSNGEVNFHEMWWIGGLRRWVIFHSSFWFWLYKKLSCKKSEINTEKFNECSNLFPYKLQLHHTILLCLISSKKAEETRVCLD